MPATSSIIFRRSSGVALTRDWISPWRTILNPFGSTPACAISSRISCLFFVCPFILYIDCPVFLTVLFIVTSFESMANVLSELSNTSSTDASAEPLYILFPEKSRFAALAARIDLIDSRPRTKQRASVMFDFPEPFGPTITFIAFSKGMSVFLAKDLNPCIVIFFMWVII